MINVAEMLIDAVKQYPDKLAVIDSKESLTYRQLYACASSISISITDYIKNSRKPVLILSEKSVWSIAAIWGVVLAGDFYASVDAGTPRERIRQYIDIVEPALILNTSSKEIEGAVNVKDIYQASASEEMQLQYAKKIIDADPLYMVFTSGSTGVPKAVIKSHRSLIAFAESFSSIFKISETDILGNQASFDFDVSAKDIYLSVFSKATLCIIPSMCFLVPSTLEPFLSKNNVTTLIWSAAAVKYVAKMNCFRDGAPSAISKVFFSGEVMPISFIRYWQEHCANTSFVNLYAPSEVTGNCLYHIVDKEDELEDIVPLSDTFPNVEVIISKNKRAVKANEKGEIYVRGAFLADGYYNNIKTTKAAFVQNPLCSAYTDRIYKTGDIAQIKNGKIYFIGRKDNQIKHLGHRIELEEIEKNVFSVLGCGEGCAVYDKESERIIVLLSGMKYERSEVFSVLKSHLPKYMIPDEVLTVNKIPLSPRGKVDRKAALRMYMESRKDG